MNWDPLARTMKHCRGRAALGLALVLACPAAASSQPGSTPDSDRLGEFASPAAPVPQGAATFGGDPRAVATDVPDSGEDLVREGGAGVERERSLGGDVGGGPGL